MKNTRNRYHRLLFSIAFLMGGLVMGYAQHRTAISLGAGLPELFNVGGRRQVDQFQLGAFVGAVPGGRDEQVFSLGLDGYLHFGKASPYVDLRPWYGRVGVSYLRDKMRREVEAYGYLNARIGREFNTSERFGLFLELGLMAELFYEETDQSSSDWFDFDLPGVLPGIGAGIFWRF